MTNNRIISSSSVENSDEITNSSNLQQLSCLQVSVGEFSLALKHISDSTEMGQWMIYYFITELEKICYPVLAAVAVLGINSLSLTSSYKIVEVVFIVIAAGSLSLATIIGNILVIVSIKVNRHLQTINNYFIFSLACADLIIGAVSMNLYTIYIVYGNWPLGSIACDFWLAADYVVSYASFMNLLMISLDRYLCVAKPVSYPLKKRPKLALVMIAAAWVLPFIMWAPSIIFWQYLVGERTVNEGDCYVQFFSNPAITLSIGIASFYLPVLIIAILYTFISRASKSRIKQVKTVSEKSKSTVSSSPVKDKITQANNTRRPTIPDMFLHDQIQTRKITDQMITDNYDQRHHYELTSDSSYLSALPANENQEEAIQDNTSYYMAQNYLRIDNSDFFSTKKVSKSEEEVDCGSTLGILVSINRKKRDNRMIRTDHNLNNTRRITTKKVTKSRESKVITTIIAIVLAFIITGTPYNIMMLLSTFCSVCVPDTMWTIGYWLCYINSTINPACYALCNATFKKTFKNILSCKYKNIGATR
ncbi:muscarinic acetylcholine receptor M2-like [Chiloscyllium plagiosum]|uniref:muscarinic acetylcholine receptor M2-like n=1 Tax=Chiloscyllium plagiosum TaxID=36176 RepID=UPI001CB7C3C5|nr:muscarinic acetylcholine receptor M2-like [Chiloscyllium plagiosum]